MYSTFPGGPGGPIYSQTIVQTRRMVLIYSGGKYLPGGPCGPGFPAVPDTSYLKKLSGSTAGSPLSPVKVKVGIRDTIT